MGLVKPSSTVTMAATVGEDAVLSEIKRLRASYEQLSQDMTHIKQEIADLRCTYCYGVGHSIARCRIKNPRLAEEGWEPKSERLKELFYENKARLGLMSNHKPVVAMQSFTSGPVVYTSPALHGVEVGQPAG